MAGKSAMLWPQKPQCAAPIGLKASQRPQTIPTSSDPSAMAAIVILPIPGAAKGSRWKPLPTEPICAIFFGHGRGHVYGRAGAPDSEHALANVLVARGGVEKAARPDQPEKDELCAGLAGHGTEVT